MLRITVVYIRRRPEDRRADRLTIYSDQWERFVRLSRRQWPFREIVQAFTLLTPTLPAPERIEDRWDPALFITPAKIEEACYPLLKQTEQELLKTS